MFQTHHQAENNFSIILEIFLTLSCRLQYSYPGVENLAVWAFMANIGFDDFKGARDFFENTLNEKSAPYVDSGIPAYPNAAGMKYIELTKGEFATNQTIRNIPNQEEKVYQRNIAYGEYDVTLKDAAGNVIFESRETIENDPECDQYGKGVNLVEGNLHDQCIFHLTLL